MPKFRKKPVIIEAIQYDGTHITAHKIYDLSHGQISYIDEKLTIRTLEGTMVASPGDWIIKGVKGEFYPCKDEIFRETYEHVSD